jgi:hypothetical protein
MITLITLITMITLITLITMIALITLITMITLITLITMITLITYGFFVSFRIFFSDNTRVRIFIFFVALSAKFFSRIQH